MDAGQLAAADHRVEEDLGHPEPLVGEGDLVAVRHLVDLLELRRVLRALLDRRLHVPLAHVTVSLLHVAHDLLLRRGGHHVAALGHDLDHVLGEVATSEVEALDRVGQREALVHRDHVRHAVATVNDAAGRAAVGVQRHDGLDDHEARRTTELVEQHLDHALPILLGVHRRLADNHRVVLGVDAEGVKEGVVPDLLHVAPVLHDAVLDRVGDREDTLLGHCLLAHEVLPLVAARHHHVMLWPSDDRREDAGGGLRA
mmetsp:Transcript_29177/g.86630  ORF Transcript_29177/g.86630 Transcript_29177/m.86630 type:complete len:256 (-) Transcript_29177:145-912(-)